MASSGKFDLSSGSPDRSLYNNGPPRGSYTATSLDVTSFLQCLRFDPKSMSVDHKFNRHGEFKRLASAALGAPEGSPSGLLKTKPPSSTPEDLKRLRAGLRESTIKARDRVKIFSSSLSVINKCFPSIPSRKRSRPDALPGVDRPNGLLVNRAVAGAGAGRTGSKSHALANASDFEHQKAADRGRNAIPNKRTRTSMVDQRADVRPNTPARSSGNTARDKEVLRPPNSNAFQNEDRTLPIVANGWEKAKMKKKRTGIKVDAAPSPSSAPMKPVDGYREPKQGMHSYGFRPGAANAVVGAGKSDGSSQQAGIGVRSSIPRPEQENTSPLHDKRDWANSSEKERTNLRAVNKANVREEFISGSPTSSTKPQTVARGPRSGSGVVPKSSPVVRRAAASSDWELSHGANKLGPTNRKRTLSTRSSSPPVAQWADRRPQKMSRTARRTNLVPIVSSNDEAPTLDTSDASENGPGPAKRFPAGSPQHFKTKNKLVNDEDRVDGVRRQGRAGRGFVSSRSAAPTAVRNVGTAKQLRTARLGFEKSESKPGRPPSRKLSDRKAYTRQKHTAINAAADFHVGLDDGHNELSAAVKAVIDPDRALSSPFWSQMEPLFGFVSDVDMCYLKQQGSIQSAVTASNGPGTAELVKNGTESGDIEPSSELFAPGTASPREILLCQRLLAALIPEEDEELACSGSDACKFDVYGSAFRLETDEESNACNHRPLHRFGLGECGTFSCYRTNSAPKSCNESVDGLSDDHQNTGSDHGYDRRSSDPATTSSTMCSEYQYGNMSIDERLLLEIQSIGLSPEVVPVSAHKGDEISGDIGRLEEKHHEQVSRKKILLNVLLKSANEARELHEKEFEPWALNELTGMAYQKYMSCWGPGVPGGKSVGGKMARQAALAFVKRTLDRCHEFEATGKSCFSEPLFKEMFLTGPSHVNDAQVDAVADCESEKLYRNPVERASGTDSSNHRDPYPSDANHPSDQSIGKDDVWSSRVKKRELYLDDVVAGTSSATPTAILNGTKGKRSDREVLSRNGPPKVGRPASGNVKGERKTKAKLKQKANQLSASVNGPLGKISDQHKTTLLSVPKPVERKTGRVPENHDKPLDFSGLQLPEMDDLGEQGQDLGSWLNIDDDGLQDDDFMGLEIPMDDLADLNMMV